MCIRDSVDTEVIDAINRYLDVRENPVEGYLEDNYRRKLYHKDAVFLNGNGQRLKGRAINYMMKNYALESGVTKKKIHTHLWRSSGITIADSKNVSLGQIMARSGHTNIQSVTPYLNAKKDLTNRNISKALSCETENSTSPEINKSYSEILKQMRKLEKENKKLREELDRDYMTYG